MSPERRHHLPQRRIALLFLSLSLRCLFSLAAALVDLDVHSAAVPEVAWQILLGMSFPTKRDNKWPSGPLPLLGGLRLTDGFDVY